MSVPLTTPQTTTRRGLFPKREDDFGCRWSHASERNIIAVLQTKNETKNTIEQLLLFCLRKKPAWFGSQRTTVLSRVCCVLTLWATGRENIEGWWARFDMFVSWRVGCCICLESFFNEKCNSTGCCTQYAQHNLLERNKSRLSVRSAASYADPVLMVYAIFHLDPMHATRPLRAEVLCPTRRNSLLRS